MTEAPALDQPDARGERISQAGEQRSARIESLRALAALSVMFGHIAAVSFAQPQTIPGGVGDLNAVQRLLYGGGLGVLFFFALSGYLLFWPFAKRYFGGGDHIDLGKYAVNRALRIFPLYYFVVVVVLAIQYDVTNLRVWARFLTFTQNYSDNTVFQFVGTTWSLVCELQFYILLPLLAWGLSRLSRGSRRNAMWLLVAAAAGFLAIRAATVYIPKPPSHIWRASLPSTFLFFLPGMLLALIRLSWEERQPSWLRGALRRGDVWILATVPLWCLVLLVSYKLDALVGVAAFLMIGACVLPLQAGPLTRALQWKPLAILGVASYSLYLWHVPAIKALRDWGVVSDDFASQALIAAPIAILVALASYRLIESPFLRLRKQWARASAEQRTT